MAIESTGPNAEQITNWNGTFGQRWVEHQEMLDAQIEPLGRTAQERARISQGEHVLDVGCGCGQSTLEIAERIGTSGHVVGIDISETMLARATVRASE
ncbi:MAG: methyltransferase domain-containing protein, partial [Myxococcota bacterium]